MKRLAEQGLKGGEGVDAGFAPDDALRDGDVVSAPAEDWRLTTIWTPGHTADHLSFAFDSAEAAAPIVFTGTM